MSVKLKDIEVENGRAKLGKESVNVQDCEVRYVRGTRNDVPGLLTVKHAKGEHSVEAFPDEVGEIVAAFREPKSEAAGSAQGNTPGK